MLTWLMGACSHKCDNTLLIVGGLDCPHPPTLPVLISSLVLEDPSDATIYCGEHDYPWTVGAYAVMGLLILLAGLVLLGTMLDRLDRALKRVEVAQGLKAAADVSATNATVQAVMYTPPMADVDGGVSSGVALGGGAAPPSLARGLPPPGDQVEPSFSSQQPLGLGSRGGDWNQWSQGGGDEVTFGQLRRLGSGGGGALVAASSSARISLGGAYAGAGASSPIVGVTASLSRGRTVYGSPTGMELAGAGVFGMPLGSEDRLQPRSVDLPAASFASNRSPNASRAGRLAGGTLPLVPGVVTPMRQRSLGTGDFPAASDADASSDFVGHAKARRVSSESAESHAGDAVRGLGAMEKSRRTPYDLFAGPALRTALKCFSFTYNWPRLVSIAPLRAGELAALNGIRTLSLCLIIFGQTVLSMVPVGFSNSTMFSSPKGVLTSWFFQGVLSSDFGVGEFSCSVS
jgi:hypothetical protein